MTHREGKFKRSKWSRENIDEALCSITKEPYLKIRQASRQFGIPESTLRKHLANPANWRGSMGRKPIFKEEDENELSKQILTMSEMYYGITPLQLRRVAFDFAEAKKIQHNFNKEQKVAGKDWLRLFLRRHSNISLRQPEGTSLNRISAFNKLEIDRFFATLNTSYEKYKFEPHRIFNVDETGVTVVQNKCSRVYAEKGKKRVRAITSGERGRTVTALFCMSALGTFVPPMMIYPRVRMDQRLQHNGPEGGIYKCSKNGWTNDQLFIEWLEHFVKMTKPSANDPVLLVMDNHSSHVSLAACQFCQQNHIVIVTLPPHTSHRTQPLNVVFFAPFKNALRREMEMYLAAHPFEKITEYFLAEFVNKAFKSVASIEKGISGFKSTGIWPLNACIFDNAFIDLNSDVQEHNEEQNMLAGAALTMDTATESASDDAIDTNNSTSVDKSINIMDHSINTSNESVESCSSTEISSPSSSILLKILPTPKKSATLTETKRNSRPKMHSEIFTLSPSRQPVKITGKRKQNDTSQKENKNPNKKMQKQKKNKVEPQPVLKRSRRRPKNV